MDDVIVVGAGPAGNNTALGLATRGFAVTVIDSRHDIGEKLCTGIVGQECTARFPIDPAFIYREAASAEVTPPCDRRIRLESETPLASIIDRGAYVASFAHKARDAGAKYKLGQRVSKVTPQADGVTVTTNEGTYLSRALVLASGFGSPLTRQLGLGSVPDYVTGAQAVVTTNGLSEVNVFLGKDVAPGFFSWLVPTAPGRALAGLLVRKQAQARLDRFIQRLQGEGRIDAVAGDVACWGVPLRPLRHTYRDRVLVVGDAAGQVKPTTGGGIFYALLASEIASQALAEALEADELSASKLGLYQRRWKRLLSRELEVGYSARRLFEALNDHQINSLVRQADTNGLRTTLTGSMGVSFDWHSRMIGKIVRQPLLAGALGLINPLLARMAQPAESDYTVLPTTGGWNDPLADLTA